MMSMQRSIAREHEVSSISTATAFPVIGLRSLLLFPFALLLLQSKTNAFSPQPKGLRSPPALARPGSKAGAKVRSTAFLSASTRYGKTSLRLSGNPVNGGDDGGSYSESSGQEQQAKELVVLDEMLRQCRLGEAGQYLRSNPELPLSSERWNAVFGCVEERTAGAEENTVNLRMAAEFPAESEARQEMADAYVALKDRGDLRLYGAVDSKLPPAAGGHRLPPALLEEILDLPMSSLTPRPTNSVLWAGAAVACLEAAVATSTGIPLSVLAFATMIAFLSDRLFLNGAVFESLLKLSSPGLSSKIRRHEAGHFLAAYLLGCPVEGIVLSAWAALQDRRFGARQVSAGTSFFDVELSQQINRRQQVTRSAIDRYSIIVMAGIAAEAEYYGRADGGAGDEMALVAFLAQLNGGRPSSVAWNDDTIRNQARWGALQAVLMLRRYRPAYEALVDALERGGRLGDCVFAIEQAAREHDLEPMTGPDGYIVEQATTVRWSTAKEHERQGQQDEQKKDIALAAAATAAASLNEEESLATLRDYRAVVEEKLRVVEQQLKEMQQ